MSHTLSLDQATVAQRNQGFALADQHRGVIMRALTRIGTHRGDPDYDEQYQEAVLIYVKYAINFHESLATRKGLHHFNQLAGHFVYLGLISERRKQTHRRELDTTLVSNDTTPQVIDPTEVVDDRLDTMQQLAQLMKRLTPIEQQILLYRYNDDLSDLRIGEKLKLSRQRIGVYRQRIKDKYLAMLG